MKIKKHQNLLAFSCFVGIRGLAALLAFASSLPTARADIMVPAGYVAERIPTGPFALEQPSGLTVGRDGSVYIGLDLLTGSKSSELLRIDPSGGISEIARFNAFIGGLAINSEGELFGSLDNRTIFRYAHREATTFASGLPQYAAEKMEFDSGDNLYVAYYNAKQIVRITPAGNPSAFVTGLDGPFGVTFRDDMLYVGDNLDRGDGPGIIYEINPSGRKTNAIAPVPGRIVDLKYNPEFDGLFVANQVTRAIQRVRDTEITQFATGFNDFPRALAVGPEGSLYVTDASSLYKIRAISPIPPRHPRAVIVCPILHRRARRAWRYASATPRDRGRKCDCVPSQVIGRDLARSASHGHPDRIIALTITRSFRGGWHWSSGGMHDNFWVPWVVLDQGPEGRPGARVEYDPVAPRNAQQ